METSQEFMNAITRILNNVPEFRSPKYRYFDGGKDWKDRYFWTTEKIPHKGKPRYVAGMYKFVKTRNLFKLTKGVGFAHRKKAKAWAIHARDRRMEKLARV